MSENEIYTVLIVDDHPLFRRGVCELLQLEESIEIVGEAGTREEALELVREKAPDLVVLDLNVRGSSGLQILTDIKAEDPSQRVVMLTVSDSKADLAACIQAGADGYFLKDMDPERFLASLRSALEGQSVIDPMMMGHLTSFLRDGAEAPAKSDPLKDVHLTERERDVVALIAKGYSNKLIARELHITDGTVKGHVKNILKKLRFKTRVEAAVWASSQEHQR